jgi:hypothetical protein
LQSESTICTTTASAPARRLTENKKSTLRFPQSTSYTRRTRPPARPRRVRRRSAVKPPPRTSPRAAPAANAADAADADERRRRRRGNTKRRFAAHAIDRIMPRDSSRETAPWTAEEDEKLLRLNRTHGNRWSDIAKVMGTRSGQQCAQRWRHKVNPDIRRERWSAEEDAKVRMRARCRVCAFA